LGLIRRVWTAAGRGYAAYDEEMRKHFQTRGQRWLIWAHAWGVVIGLAFVAFMFTIFVFWSVAGFPDVFD
jgi:hypothetical protein